MKAKAITNVKYGGRWYRAGEEISFAEHDYPEIRNLIRKIETPVQEETITETEKESTEKPARATRTRNSRKSAE